MPPKKQDTQTLVSKFTAALRGSGAIDVPALQRGVLQMLGGEQGLAQMLVDGYEGAEDEPNVRVKYVSMILDVLIPKGQETGENLSIAADKDLEAVMEYAVNATAMDDDSTTATGEADLGEEGSEEPSDSAGA